MAQKSQIAKIARLTSKCFPSLSTAGTGVAELVRFILAKKSAIDSARRKKNGPNNDARDIIFTAELLEPLSNKALEIIENLKHSKIRQQLIIKGYPFSQLNKRTRERLLHLPVSWIREGAQYQLDSRKSSQQSFTK